MALGYTPPRRAKRPWRDRQFGDAITWERRHDATDTYTVDLTDILAERGSGVTASSVAMTKVAGPTISASNVTDGVTLSVTVTAGSGFATAEVTDSNGDVFEVPLQWRASDRRSIADSYGWRP